ncbi:MAG: GxxExxY protein, partial [Burkholderiales bacterium]
GLLESVYEECICRELELNGLRFKRQVELPIEYKGTQLNVSYRIDLVVEDVLVVELKAVEELLPVHEAQLLTYMRLRRLPTGLLINFNVPVLKQGIKRMKL